MKKYRFKATIEGGLLAAGECIEMLKAVIKTPG
jgi:hypothetical protein